MTEASSANLELSILLPLGVVANQLMRIEAELRLLNMKALKVARERENQRLSGLIEARLDNINDVLDSIRGLVSDIAADIQPRPIDPPDRDD
jgi:ubiquinone biosynthesis protein COQ9